MILHEEFNKVQQSMQVVGLRNVIFVQWEEAGNPMSIGAILQGAIIINL